jgi:hypothetical protein
MLKQWADYLRRNLLPFLFALLIIGQFLTWYAVASIRATIEHYSCGTRFEPCKVIVVPDR